MSVIRVAADLKVSRQAIYNLKHAAAPLPPGAIPKRKVGSGTVRTTSIRTENILKCEVMSGPAVTASTLKKKHPDLLKHVAIRTVQHHLQKDLGLPTRRAAKKPLLTEVMKKKRINFCKKYQHWTSDDWKKVMFSDESIFRLVRGASKIVRRPKNVSRSSLKYTVKTVKHPDSVMVWGTFSGCEGRGGLYFHPKNVTMKGTNYIEVLRDHMLPFWPIHHCHHFMHDGAPAHKSKIVTKFLSDNEIVVLEWPGNSPRLKPDGKRLERDEKQDSRGQTQQHQGPAGGAEKVVCQHRRLLLCQPRPINAKTTADGIENERQHDQILNVR
ncbi:Transposable element Tcb2 transposase-like 1 [Homarus americanus]|uniref:Transposable element Tcb2 transposase-like 1 n=1 Tax=Homarus americanus TaxID=6706 RepID=A0A8J5N947_HOMAM|nr:Transposable element Tcb2 transposase-like 1 [Homarus americanus]